MNVERGLVDLGLFDGDDGEDIVVQNRRVIKRRPRKRRKVKKDKDDDDVAAGAQEEEDPIVSVFMVDAQEMLRLKNFYDADVEIQACRQRKKIETFRHKCTVSWWFRHDQVQLHRLPYFHEERYMRLLHDMLLRAQDFLSLFGFCAFYYVRDMIGWVLRDDGTLPFGVVELGMNRNETQGAFYSVRRDGHFERELTYECSDEAINARYLFYVFDQGAVLAPNARNYGGSAALVSPVSPFAELIDDRAEIIEARVCLGDANFMATHPEAFLCSKPLPETSIENVPEQTRYMEEDLPSAALATSLHRANLSSTLTAGYVQRFRRGTTSPAQDRAMVRDMFLQYGGGGDSQRPLGPDGLPMTPTLYQARQAEFERPSLKATLEELPSYTEVSRGHTPTALVNPTALQQQYTDKVAQLMNFPYLLFKPQRGIDGGTAKRSGGGGSLVSNGNRENAQKQLDDAVCEQQHVFQHIFEELYERTFDVMDQLLFARLPPALRESTEHISARMLFENQVTKSDESIQALLPFYEQGIVSKQSIQKLLSRNYGLLEDEEQEKRDNEQDEDGPKKRLTAKRKKKKKKKGESDDDEGDDDDDDKKDERKEDAPKKTKSEEKKRGDKDDDAEKHKEKKEKKRKADEIDHK